MRVLTALIGIPVVVAATWFGGWPFAAFVAVIAVQGQREFYHMMAARGLPSGGVAALAAGLALVLTPMEPALMYVAVLFALAALATFAFKPANDNVLATAAGTGFGIVYPALFMAFLLQMRMISPDTGVDAFRLTMGVLVLMWTADSAAYYAGRTLGRHLLAPTVSPKKTWEGVVGGVVGALVAGAAIGYWANTGIALVHWIVLGGLTATVGPCGDLFESALKRSAGVKDSANLLPGHGGALDRFDALFFVAPVVWIYLATALGI